jgi:WD40 repeat protein
VAIAGHTNVRLLHISSGVVVQNLNVEANSIMMSSDGEKVLTGCSSGSVEVYDVSTGMLNFKCSSNLGGCVVFVHWDDEFIIAATGAADGPICWDDNTQSSRVLGASRKDGSTISTWDTRETAFDYCFTSDSRLNMIFSSHKGTIVGWNLNGEEIVGQTHNLGDVVYSLASHGTEDLILSGSNDFNIREWKVSNHGKKMSLVNEVKDSTSSGWAYGGNWAVSYNHFDDDILSTEPQLQSLRIYHKNGTLLNELRGHQDCINKISLVDDGSRVVTVDRGDMSILWKLPETFEHERK